MLPRQQVWRRFGWMAGGRTYRPRSQADQKAKQTQGCISNLGEAKGGAKRWARTAGYAVPLAVPWRARPQGGTLPSSPAAWDRASVDISIPVRLTGLQCLAKAGNAAPLPHPICSTRLPVGNDKSCVMAGTSRRLCTPSRQESFILGTIAGTFGVQLPEKLLSDIGPQGHVTSIKSSLLGISAESTTNHDGSP